jgi:hypothetical protein
VLNVDQIETFKREWQAGTITRQPLQACAIPGGNPHLGIERESAVFPGEHLTHVTAVDQTTAGEPSQHPHTYLLGSRSETP